MSTAVRTPSDGHTMVALAFNRPLRGSCQHEKVPFLLDGRQGPWIQCETVESDLEVTIGVEDSSTRNTPRLRSPQRVNLSWKSQLDKKFHLIDTITYALETQLFLQTRYTTTVVFSKDKISAAVRTFDPHYTVKKEDTFIVEWTFNSPTMSASQPAKPSNSTSAASNSITSRSSPGQTTDPAAASAPPSVTAKAEPPAGPTSLELALRVQGDCLCLSLQECRRTDQSPSRHRCLHCERPARS